MSPYRIIIVLPYRGTVYPESMMAIENSSRCHEITGLPRSLSILCHNFNKLWCEVLNSRETEGTTHFAMVHSDIQAEAFWLDTQLEEMDDFGCDVVSSVIPIADDRGLTSTGVGSFGSRNVRRLTMTEIEKLPATFGINDIEFCKPSKFLAINTGLWVADIRRSWVEEFPGFNNPCGIYRERGKFMTWSWSEDWNFSEWLAGHGCKVMATRKARVGHIGKKSYNNVESWGEWETDRHFRELEK